MTSGKLGVATEDDSDGDSGGGGGRKAGATTRKKSGAKTGGTKPPALSGPGGWLGSGALGVPTEDESDDDGDVGGSGGGGPVMVSLETQTDEDIEGIVKRGEVPKLPPWAKRWTPPVPEPVVVESEPSVEAPPAVDEGSGKQVRNHECTWTVGASHERWYSVPGRPSFVEVCCRPER